MKPKIRTNLALIGAIMLILSISVIMYYNRIVGNQNLPQQIFRLILTIVLVIFMLREKMWAKWLLGIFAIMGGVLGISSSLFVFLAMPYKLRPALLLLMGLFYLFSGIYILATRNATRSK